MFKQNLSSISVTINLHIPDVIYIPYHAKIPTTLEYNDTHPPTYEHFHRTLLIQNKSNNKTVLY